MSDLESLPARYDAAPGSDPRLLASWQSLATSSQGREEGNFLLAPPMLPWKQDGGEVLNHITPVPN